MTHECRQCEISNAQRDAGVLHPVVASSGTLVGIGYYPKLEGGKADCGGRNTLSVAYALEER